MKKILSIFLLLAVANTAKGQEDQPLKKFSFGLKGAPGLGWFKPDTQKETSDGVKLNFGYGIMTEFNFTENYCFATGLEINHVKGATRQSVALGEISSVRKIQYVTLPLTLKMKTKEIGSIKYFGQFGFGSSVALKARTDVSTNFGGNVNTQNDVAADTSIALIKESLLIGLGAEYNLVGTTSLVVSVMFDNGFTNLYSKDVRLMPSYPGKLTNKSVILSVGVLF